MVFERSQIRNRPQIDLKSNNKDLHENNLGGLCGDIESAQVIDSESDEEP